MRPIALVALPAQRHLHHVTPLAAFAPRPVAYRLRVRALLRLFLLGLLPHRGAGRRHPQPH